jgi:hypothetical protein
MDSLTVLVCFGWESVWGGVVVYGVERERRGEREREREYRRC